MQPEQQQHHQYYSSASSPLNKQDQYFEICLKEIQVELNETLKSDDDSLLNTIIKRTEIAKKFNQLTTELRCDCETLIR